MLDSGIKEGLILDIYQTCQIIKKTGTTRMDRPCCVLG